MFIRRKHLLFAGGVKRQMKKAWGAGSTPSYNVETRIQPLGWKIGPEVCTLTTEPYSLGLNPDPATKCHILVGVSQAG